MCERAHGYGAFLQPQKADFSKIRALFEYRDDGFFVRREDFHFPRFDEEKFLRDFPAAHYNIVFHAHARVQVLRHREDEIRTSEVEKFHIGNQLQVGPGCPRIPILY